MEKLIENWRRFLNENQAPALYTGAVLDDASIGLLNDKIKQLNLNN